MKPDFSFGILPVLKKDGENLFLLIHQVEGHWSFPKGHANPGETELESARRELREETGIAECEILDGFKYVQHYEFEKGGETISKEVTYFMGFVKSAAVQVQEIEVAEYSWLPYKDAIAKLTFPENQKMLAAASDFLATKTRA